MSAIDWSWGQRYETPTMIAIPQATPLNTFDPPQPESQPTTAPGIQWNVPPKLITRPSLLLASRKRSRDEFSDWDDADSSRASPARRTPSPPKLRPILGPNNTLIFPNDPAYGIMSEGTQMETWAEDIVERMRTSNFDEGPGMESRKAQRLDREIPELDEAARSELPEDVRYGAAVIDRPEIDEATRTLGIGWTTIPCTHTMEAASRGWARYIENNFPLQSVRIVWQNHTMPAYLVCAVTRGPWGGPGVSGYYLFDEPLYQGRLLAKSWERVLDNLRCSPITFDGEEVMTRGGGGRQQGTSMNRDAEMDRGTANHAGVEVEMGDG